MMDVERIVRESSQGYNVSEVVKSDSVKVFNWVKYFHSLGFVSIPNILKYHSFHCDTAHPRCVLVKEHSDSATIEVKVVRGALPNILALPEQVLPKGLDIERQWYLYERIRPLCHSNLARDTCPKPLQPKPSSKTSEQPSATACQTQQSTSTTNTLAGTKRRLCSLCHLSGHNKKTCPNKE